MGRTSAWKAAGRIQGNSKKLCLLPLPHLSPSAGVAFSLWFPAPLPVLLLMASELPLDCLFPTPALLPGFDLVLWLHLPALGLL